MAQGIGQELDIGTSTWGYFHCGKKNLAAQFPTVALLTTRFFVCGLRMTDRKQSGHTPSVVAGSHVDGGGQISGPEAVVDVDDPDARSARV